MGGSAHNDYRRRGLPARIDDMTPRIPKPGIGSLYPEDPPAHWSRTDRVAAAVVTGMTADGVPARKIGQVARRTGGLRPKATEFLEDAGADATVNRASPTGATCACAPTTCGRDATTNPSARRADRTMSLVVAGSPVPRRRLA